MLSNVSGSICGPRTVVPSWYWMQKWHVKLQNIVVSMAAKVGGGSRPSKTAGSGVSERWCGNASVTVLVEEAYAMASGPSTP